ncbi:hypothetical protein [Haloarcula sp. H-GB5]
MMIFRNGSIDEEEPTHKLVMQSPSGVKDWDEEGIIGVENRAMEVILDRGSTVHVELDPAHGQFETLRNKLTQVPESDRIFVASEHEHRAVLPEDRTSVDSLLEIQANDTDEWTDRLFNIEAFAVLSDQSWTYRSVPHETHIREINTAGHDGLVEELHKTLEQLRGATVKPFDGS